MSEKSEIHQPLIHPNEENGEEQPLDLTRTVKEEDKGFVYYCKRFDEFILKPIFVYKYDKNMAKRVREFYEMMAHDGVNVEKKFVE